MNNKNKKIIIFDYDGVLLDSIPFVYLDMKLKYPSISDEDFKMIFNGNFWDGIDIIKKKYARTTDSSNITKLPIHCFANFFDGVCEMIKILSKDYILVINSSSFVNDIEKPLEREGLKECFDLILGKDQSISKPEKFTYIQNFYNADIRNMYFITDTTGDVNDTEGFELKTIGVTWGVHDKSDFTKLQSKNLIAIADTIEQLKTIITET
ncbi:HAD hydrolase-like protein [Candidatus Pacebacteria bacterium]|nr:HAD hydrolase-like protein [Candidatus Paceibacterota bacterium]